MTMNGIELDTRLREILTAATRENLFQSVAAIVKMGFGAVSAWGLVLDVIAVNEAKATKKDDLDSPEGAQFEEDHLGVVAE